VGRDLQGQRIEGESPENIERFADSGGERKIARGGVLSKALKNTMRRGGGKGANPNAFKRERD